MRTITLNVNENTNEHGIPVLSCMALTVDIEDGNIRILEGLADPEIGELHPLPYDEPKGDGK